MSELRPEDIFKNIEPGEKFHYLERESEDVHKRMKIVAIVLVFLAGIRLATFDYTKLGNVLESRGFDFITLFLSLFIAFFFSYYELILSGDRISNSGIGITNKWLYYKEGNRNSLERRLEINSISNIKQHLVVRPIFKKYENFRITVSGGDFIRLDRVKDGKRFLKTLQSLIDNQRSNNQSETR